MVFAILTKDNVFKKFDSAKAYTEELTEPFPEFERIARNRAKDSIPDNYPNTTDGTTASLIKKTPRRVVQQLPSGMIEEEGSHQEAYLSVIAEEIYTEKILPHANGDYDLIQKCWNVLESGLTVGACAVVSRFLNKDGVFTTDMQPIHWGNLFFQPGKKSGYACEYVFVRDWWQPEDIDTLIHREKKLAKEARQKGEKYDSSWDLEALEEIKAAETLKEEQAQTPSEKARNSGTTAIEIVTGYQVGVGAEFITFNPHSKKVIRTKNNNDPRGRFPVDFFYADTDGSNPFGRGIIELIGGMQNLLDSEVQMYQYNRALQLNPPLLKRGNFSSAKIKFLPNAIIDLGDDPNARVEPLKIDTSALTNFSNHYSLMKSQIYNLTNANGDSTISSTVGDIASSKTPAGVKQAQEMISIDDNFLRRMFEAFWENLSETLVNLYFSERKDTEIIQLTKPAADRLRKLIEGGKAPADILNENDEVIVDFSKASGALKFRVNASTSKKQSDQEQADAIIALLERAETSPILQGTIPQEKFMAAWNALVSASGVEDSEKLTIDIDQVMAEQQAQMEAMQAEQMQQQEMMQPEVLPEVLPEMQPEIATAEPTEDEQIAMALRNFGASDSQIQEAFQLLDEGVSADEIMHGLRGAVNG